MIRAFYFAFAAFLFLGCNGEESKENNHLIANRSISFIESPASGKQYPSGMAVELQLKLRNIPEDLDSVFFLINGFTIYSSGEKKDVYYLSYKDTLSAMGTRSFKTILRKKDGTIEENSALFTIVSDVEPARYTFKVNAKFPHDKNAYTQGLEFDNGNLYEGTGLEGKSELRLVERTSGKVIKSTPVENNYFGEGITIMGDNIYQLTYRARTGYVYNKKSFEKTGEFRYNTEGWGLTNDGTHLIYSDGTHQLYFLDPESMQLVQILEVFDHIGPKQFINELEYINGEIWANIYQTNEIIRIEASTGKVKGVIDLNGILAPEDMHSGIDVLNGIAFEKATGKIFVTGKNYPWLWEISVMPVEN